MPTSRLAATPGDCHRRGLAVFSARLQQWVAPILRVHTKEVSACGTPEHRVKVMTADGLQWRMLNELKSGD